MSRRYRPGRVSAPTRRRRSAVTLVEVLVSTILVSTLLLVSITASANLLRNQAQQFAAADSVEVLSRLLDEVSAAEFRDPQDGGSTFGLDAGESAGDRSSLDDVDDYHGYQMSPPRHRDGSPIDGFDGWSAEISVARARPSGAGIERVPEAEGPQNHAPLRVITATLIDRSGRRWTQSVWVADVPVGVPPQDSYERLRHLELSFPDQQEVNLAIPLRNRPAPIEY